MVVRQVIDGELDKGALDDRQLALVACPGAAGLQPGVHAVPGAGGGSAVPAGLAGGGHVRAGAGGLVSELELAAMPQRGAHLAGLAGWRRLAQHPVRAKPPEHLHRQVAQQPGQPGRLVPGVEDHHDVRVTVAPVPGGDDPLHDLADLRGGDRGQVIVRSQPHRVQQPGPAGAAWLQRGHQRVRPARDHLRAILPPPVAVAERPLRAGRRVRPQPVADIDGQPDPPVIPGRQRHRGQRPAQPRDLDSPAVQRVVQGPMATLVPWLQRQLSQHQYPARLAQHGVGKLKQRIRAPGQAPVHLAAERRQPLQRTIRPGPAAVLSLNPGHTESHGHRHLRQILSQEPDDDHAVAACQYPDTPANGDPSQAGQQRLNSKLSDPLCSK